MENPGALAEKGIQLVFCIHREGATVNRPWWRLMRLGRLGIIRTTCLNSGEPFMAAMLLLCDMKMEQSRPVIDGCDLLSCKELPNCPKIHNVMCFVIEYKSLARHTDP